MRPLPPFPLTCAWGALCGALLGAARTREASLHLLAKGRALEALGVPSLPGPSHWGVLASWQPVGAGALFFGLSLGLGWGALVALFAAVVRRSATPWSRRRLAAGAAVPALWAAAGRDWGLAAALLAVGAEAAALAGDPRTALTPRRALLAAGCFLLVAVGLTPWLLAPEGAFTRLRDRWLLAPGPGLAVDTFYYRWTLYPAEALKDLRGLSQPTVSTGSLPPDAARRFAREALPLRLLGVPAPLEAADLAVAATAEDLRLVAGHSRVAWPKDPAARSDAWARVARESDPAERLRTATAVGLFWGCPLGLAWAVGVGCLRLAARLAPHRPAPLALGLASALALGLGAAGWPTTAIARLRDLQGGPSLPRVERALAAGSAAERFHAARGAGRLGPGAAPGLLAALRDPVVNVRYAAAESLGTAKATTAKGALLGVLRSEEEWYVKERAYAALWRLGWRPSIP